MRRRVAPANPTVVRLPFLEGLRGLAALYVALGHICSMADPSIVAGTTSKAPAWLQHLMAPFAYGHLAVASFIVLSGFCLQLSLFSNTDGRIGNMKRWFARRARRILPAYYGALAVSLAVALTITVKQSGEPFATYLPITWQNVAAHVLMVHNLSLDWMYKINGVMWSIAVEVQLYLVFPLLVASVFRIGRFSTFVATVLLASAVIAYASNAGKLYSWYLPLFVLGMLSAHMAYRPNLRTGTQPMVAYLVSGAAALIAAFGCSTGWQLYQSDAVLGISVAALCYALTVTEDTWICRSLSWQPIVGLGAFSYSLYLVHHPIEQIVYAHRPASIQGEVAVFWFLLVIGLPLMVVGTWLFSLVFERPFMPKYVQEKETFYSGLTPVSLPLKTFVPTARTARALAPTHRSEDREKISA